MFRIWWTVKHKSGGKRWTEIYTDDLSVYHSWGELQRGLKDVPLGRNEYITYEG
jgi:hypothetical protein